MAVHRSALLPLLGELKLTDGTRSFVGLADEPLVPYSEGEGEEASGDAGVDANDGACAVVFEGGLACHRVEDGLDPLAYSGEFPQRGFSFLR